MARAEGASDRVGRGVSLGGAQEIPRPPDWRPGDPRPWVDAIGTDEFFATVRSVYAGRVGAPAAVEGRPGIRRSAVLAAWYLRDDEPYVLCTRRSWNLRTHRGEVSFPGGGEEAGDASLHETALREAWEEVGLDPASVEVLGELDHLTTVTSDRFIVPVVGLLDAPPVGLVAQESEVEQILEVPLSALLHPDAFREERWGSLGIDHPIAFFEIEGDTIWGATGAMLHQFLRTVLPPAA
jgi:8-oxo-dGTP pyrophosphatase MutT (NUDIX family)